MGIHFHEPDDYIQILEITPATRRSIENAIERLIALLDTLDPDADFESDADGEPSIGWPDGSPGRGAVACEVAGEDDREDENEHGGDILDELHDACDEGDDEPDLGRLETMHQGKRSYGGEDPATDGNSIGNALVWRQDGYAAGIRLLGERGLPTLKGTPGI